MRPGRSDDRRLQSFGEIDRDFSCRQACAPRRSASSTGFCAATSIRAASAMAAESPSGGVNCRSLGMCTARSSAEWDFPAVRHRRRGARATWAASWRFCRRARPIRRSGARRSRSIVPLDVIAHHGGGVLDAVSPFDGEMRLVASRMIADDDVNRNAVAPGVVNRHGGVLESDGAVSHDEKRLAFDLGVAMSHGDGGFFVAAGDELGILIAAVIDDRFVQAAKARAGIGADVLDSERLDDIDHEVGAGAIGGEDFRLGGVSASAAGDIGGAAGTGGAHIWRERFRSLFGAATNAAAPAAALFRKLRRLMEFLLRVATAESSRMRHLVSHLRSRRELNLSRNLSAFMQEFLYSLYSTELSTGDCGQTVGAWRSVQRALQNAYGKIFV